MRKGSCVVFTFGLLSTVAFVRTSTAQERSMAQERKYESSQNFAAELRFSPYTAEVDNDPALKGTPYGSAFGYGERLAVQVELDWQALRIPYVGTIGPGVSAGYTAMSGFAFLKREPSSRSGTETTLEIFPFYAVGVLRVDVLNRAFKIPLVPYVKAGVAMGRWRSYTESGTSSASRAAKGTSYGTQVAVGLAFDMNVFDNYTARNFDNSLGVNHTYIFAEYYSLSLSNFQSSDALWVGTTSWAMGLTFEF
jgi:hypothetical protein